jgi:hypothetical protein
MPPLPKVIEYRFQVRPSSLLVTVFNGEAREALARIERGAGEIGRYRLHVRDHARSTCPACDGFMTARLRLTF